MTGVCPIVVLPVHGDSEANLLHIRQTGGLPSLLPGLGKDGKKDRGEDGDYGDNDEQLNQREATLESGQGTTLLSNADVCRYIRHNAYNTCIHRKKAT